MLNEGLRYRHEFKYIESGSSLLPIEKRLAAFMRKDSHVPERGFYNIRSLYFDDYDNSFLQENIDGTDLREKWRIRIYNHSSSVINLEKKSRKGDLIRKDSCALTREQYETALKGSIDIRETNQPLFNAFCISLRERLLHPVVIVEYERTPFTAKEGNVRVTFDRNIRSSPELDALLSDRELKSRPVLTRGQDLLEVKYDAFLPNHIAHAIEYGKMQRTSFSKYALARRFPYNGVILTGYSKFINRGL